MLKLKGTRPLRIEIVGPTVQEHKYTHSSSPSGLSLSSFPVKKSTGACRLSGRFMGSSLFCPTPPIRATTLL